MLGKYDVKKFIETHQHLGNGTQVTLSEDRQDVMVNGEKLCSVTDFTLHLRRELHCDFEEIWSCHASLDEVYRCRECGTVIFGGDDEFRYDPDERCPVCCNDPSVCHNEYWTAEEIKNDKEKQKTIEAYEQMAKMEAEAEARRKARGGLYDWERWKHRIRTKRYVFTLEHLCFGWGKRVKKKQRFFRISCSVWDGESYVRGCGKGFSISIPLNFYTFYIAYIYRYTKDCPPYLRKNAFWQKSLTSVSGN